MRATKIEVGTKALRAGREVGGVMSCVWFAVVDIAAHDGFITPRWAPDIWTPENPSGWTYQDVTGAHGTILHEGRSAAEAQAVLDGWLDCPATRAGRYYTHNPTR